MADKDAKKEPTAKKVNKSKVSSGIDMYRNQKVAAHSFPKKRGDDIYEESCTCPSFEHQDCKVLNKHQFFQTVSKKKKCT